MLLKKSENECAFEKNVICINRGEEGFFSYTDKQYSYLMLNNKYEKKSDGFIFEDITIFKDFNIKLNKKVVSRFHADYVELYPEHFIFYFTKQNIVVRGFVIENKNSVLFQISTDKVKDNVFFQLTDNDSNVIKSFIISQNESYCLIGLNANRERITAFGDEAKIVLQNNNSSVLKALSSFKVNTGDESLDKAIVWSTISGINLVTGKKDDRGIWAGLPWFRDNWGRDTFIALPGILLVIGQFSEAKQIIENFAKYQDKNPESNSYGRIPNRYRNENDVIYNTADGTLWFIREVLEYVNYTGDIDFLSEMWPIIYLAVSTDAKLRTDNKGYLLHDDADTWMDARLENKQALSPRGNKANDIQVLWYIALNSCVQIANILNKKSEITFIEQILQKIKKNFVSDFLLENEQYLYDYIDSNNKKHDRLRPNQLFAITLCDYLNNNEVLINKIQAKSITKNVCEKLCFPWGVASLDSNDYYFHPYHVCNKYHKDAAYHNGAIWLWNSGPFVSAMCTSDWQDKAFEHTQNLVNQLLNSECRGSLSENLNAYPSRKGTITATGTWSQAWSVSEFNRVIFQDYIGLVPKLLENKIQLRPKMPKVWLAGSVEVPIGDGKIIYSWSAPTIFDDYSVRQLSVNYTGNKKIQLIISDKNETHSYELTPVNSVSCEVIIQNELTKICFAKPHSLKNNIAMKKKNFLFNAIRKGEY